MTSTVTRPNWKKLVLQMLIGAVVGAAAAAGVLYMLDDVNSSDPAQLFAIVTGLTYALMGLMVGLGAIAPRAGARLLNVEDVDELLDQRTIFGLSAAACVMIGLLFLILGSVPAGGMGGAVGRELAAALVAFSFVSLIFLTYLTNRRVDELTRQVGMEASSLALQASFVIFGGWAALAHLGFVDWIEPLALVAGMALLQLLAVFWAAGKRGMMVPEMPK
jgi:hypothetical protein